MAFKDLDEFFDDTLRLPVGGKWYVVPPPSAETGLFCQQLMEAGLDAANGADVDAANLDDVGEEDLYRRVLGSTLDELRTDGVTWPKIKHCGITAFLWIAANKETAEKFWESGGGDHPESEAPNRATRRATAAVARSTQSRGSASGTSRKTTQAKKASTGKTS